MKKLFYILPEYHKGTSTHFGYNVELLEELAKHMKVYLFIEKGEKPDVKNIQYVRVGRFHFLPFRLIERAVIFKFARLSGYKYFYSHYGYLSALIAGIICKFSFGKFYFWHCEMRGNYEKKSCFLCNLPEKLTLDWPYRIILKICGTLVTCTPKMKKYYQDTFNVPAKKIKVVGNWVDVKALAEKAKTKKCSSPTMFFVHWLSPRKGSRILPEIFAAIHDKMPDVKFVIAGTGPDFDWLKSEWKRLGLSSKVEMLGAVPNTEIAKLFGQSHLLLHPSREEEFGRVLIEAMACGTPIVASNTFGAQSVLNKKQKELIFDHSKPEDAAKLCVKILQSSKLQKEFKEEGFKRVQDYDKDKIVQEFLNMFGL